MREKRQSVDKPVKCVVNSGEKSFIKLSDGTIIFPVFGYDTKGVWCFCGFRVVDTSPASPDVLEIARQLYMFGETE